MSKGHRVRGGISGAVCGLGIAVLAQQFGLGPLTLLTAVLLPLGMALVSVAVGWPRWTGAAPIVAAPNLDQTGGTRP